METDAEKLADQITRQGVILMFTSDSVPDSLWNCISDAMLRLTCRQQVPETLLSTLVDHGVVPGSAPSLETMKQLLVDAFQVFDHRVARDGEVARESSFYRSGRLRREAANGADART